MSGFARLDEIRGPLENLDGMKQGLIEYHGRDAAKLRANIAHYQSNGMPDLAKECETEAQWHEWAVEWIEAVAEVAKASDALEEWLAKNTGTNDDWPLKMVMQNEAEADALTRLLHELSQSLKAYRADKE